jgi:NAD(P)-dependent dehydrogenase (short-subunit alcohol dehydrogenase family)
VAIARGIAESCVGTEVTANSVLAGPTASEGATTFVAEFAEEQNMTPAAFEKEFFKSIRPTSLLKRFLSPDEVAKVVVFICSPEAAAITGAAIRADGGVIRAAM